MKEERYSFHHLHSFCTACFVRFGVPQADAAWTSKVLLNADLQERPSHGISRLSAYVRGIEIGKIHPAPTVQETRTGFATAIIDGDNGLGPVVAKRGIELAMVCAREVGVGIVTVRSGNHAGMMGTYTSLAADEGLIGIALTNGQPAIPPWGGRTAFFGTNPIAMSAGRGDRQITIDLATSVVARGNIIMAAQAGRAIPDSWALDAEGVPTTDANSALRGALLPMAGPKGYSLALLVEILSGVLSGAAVGHEVGSIYDERGGLPNTGMFFMVLDPEHFIGLDSFHERLSDMEIAIHESPTAQGTDNIYIPGERRREMAQERLRTGIPVGDETRKELLEVGERIGVAFTDLGMMG